MSEQFYRAFEDRYRGSRELIKDRLRAYLDFVAPLAALSQPAAALDLGCGRGEWLELLSEQGFAARGVDLDSGMLAACRERGLSVETMDAIGALKALADDSVAVVSAFHLVEHLPFAAVQELVTQALRVLQPGGLLIMETPNPENPLVGACRFYLDPSHVKPLPPLLLSFVTDYAGFARTKIVRLQEDPALHSMQPLRLINVLDGASPDYSVVAQKAAPEAVLNLFKAPFEREFGLCLTDLAERFDETRIQAHRQLSKTIDNVSEAVGQHEAKNDILHAQLAAMQTQLANHGTQLIHTQEHGLGLGSKMAELTRQLAALEATVGAHETTRTQLEVDMRAVKQRLDTDLAASRQQSEVELAAVKAQLDAVLKSTSWRLTRPLRSLKRLLMGRRS